MPDTVPTVLPGNGFILSGKLYDRAKWFVMIFLPAVSTLYFALGNIWGFPYVTEVIGSISALTAFLGVILGISTKAYNASDVRFGGAIDIAKNEAGTKVFSLNLNSDPEEIEMLPEVTFKINPPEI